jgi:hypothetical protein
MLALPSSLLVLLSTALLTQLLLLQKLPQSHMQVVLAVVCSAG